jgi:retron-type reverse transcriptase
LNYSISPPLDTSFKHRPIGTLASLGRMLKVPSIELESIAEKASSLYYIAGRQRKSDGTYRELVDARRPLKSIQARIQCLILRHVYYPGYLQGGIHDKQSPRGQAANARIHVGRRTLITEDIESFFPNVTSELIFDIWQGFFRFAPAVARCLTRLTTKEGSLPQGAKTSPLLANLVFWREEHDLVTEFLNHGIFYSRLIDDITCSSKQELSFKQISWLIRRLHAMGKRCGLRLKRKKQTIAYADEPMIATKLIVNSKVSLPRQSRGEIRASVHGYLTWLKQEEEWRPGSEFDRVSGRLSYFTQHHRAEGTAMRMKLRMEIDKKKSA